MKSNRLDLPSSIALIWVALIWVALIWVALIWVALIGSLIGWSSRGRSLNLASSRTLDPRTPTIVPTPCYEAAVRAQKLIDETLAELAAADLLREPDDGGGRAEAMRGASKRGVPLIDASSNDYLGLGENHVSRETLSPAGAGSSRLIHGTRAEHVALESALADWVGAETALLFPSTYSANLGLVSALGVEGSLIVSDAANHASLIDGARLARAQVRVIPHLDLDALRTALAESMHLKSAWVLTESYFSMDGDGPDLASLRRVCDEHDAFLIVDEAHALGVFGPNGAGRCAEAGIRPDALVGALGKAVGSHGGFIAGTAKLRRYLWNKARSFVFSTALSPAHASTTLDQAQRARSADAERAKLASNVEWLRARLHEQGLELIPHSFGPIISLRLGDNDRALAAAARLRASGILAQAIRPPTVPKGSARLRLTVKSTFSAADLERLRVAIGEACAS